MCTSLQFHLPSLFVCMFSKQVAAMFNQQENVLKLSMSATCDSGELTVTGTGQQCLVLAQSLHTTNPCPFFFSF